MLQRRQAPGAGARGGCGGVSKDKARNGGGGEEEPPWGEATRPRGKLSVVQNVVLKLFALLDTVRPPPQNNQLVRGTHCSHNASREGAS